MAILRADNPPVKPPLPITTLNPPVTFNEAAEQVRSLAVEHLANPNRRAADSARTEYIRRLVSASVSGQDVDREADEWLATLRELVQPHLGNNPTVDHWYGRELSRLLALVK